MKLEKSIDIVWGENGVTVYLLSQRYRGRKYASIVRIADDTPEATKAKHLKDVRRTIRVQLARTERRFQKAAKRSSRK